MVKSIFAILTLTALGSARWTSEQHEYSADASAQVANAIKQKL